MLPLLALLQVASAFVPLQDDRFVNQSDVTTLSTPTITVDPFPLPTLHMKQQQVLTTNKTSIQVGPGMSTIQTDAQLHGYFVNVTVGGNTFPLLLDTASAYMWIYGSTCKSQACSNQPLFNAKGVSTNGASFSLNYASGSASGDVFQSSLLINQLSADQVTFGVANTVPSMFNDYPISGILGLPYGSSSSIPSMMSALSQSKAVSSNKFSLSLGSISASSDMQNSGLFAIGEPVDGLYVGDINYYPVMQNDNQYWNLNMAGIAVNDVAVGFTNAENFTGSPNWVIRSVIIDSGTSLLVLPAQDANDLHSHFTNAITDGKNYAIWCNSTDVLSFHFGQEIYNLGPEYYLSTPYPSNSEFYGYCVSNIQGANVQDSWIIGDVFLRSVYAVFDIDNQKVGFATKNNAASLVAGSTTVSAPAPASTSGATTLTTAKSSSHALSGALTAFNSISTHANNTNGTVGSSRSKGGASAATGSVFMLVLGLLVNLC